MAEKWLVIDDSATIQRVIKLAFQDYDVSITEADSCQEALRELTRTPSTLVIADAALAGVQSVQDFSVLKQSSPHSAFVILEGSYDHIDEKQFRGAGFRYFLKKPFDAAQLIAITREALGRPIPNHQDLQVPPALPKPFTLPSELLEIEADSAILSQLGSAASPGVPNPFISRESVDLGLDPKHDPMAETQPRQEYQSDYKPSENTFHMTNSSSYEPSADYSDPKREGAYIASPLSGMLEPMLQEEMAKLVRQSVEDYCRKHFAELAREYLTREIDKLTQERSRLLVDK